MLKEQRSPDRAFESDPERDRAVARTCLGRLTPDCSRDEWVSVGMALHSLGEDMRSDWHGWSSGGASYSKREADRQWDSFRPGGGVTVGTLIQMAGLSTDELRSIGRDVPAVERVRVKASTTPKPTASPDETTDRQAFGDLDEAVSRCTPRGFREAGRWRYTDDWWQVRFDDGKGGKQFRPFSRDGSGGKWSCTAPPVRPLYRQDELDEDDDQVVLVVEGEKCADIAAELGFAAVACSNGAQSPHKSEWSALHGRQVVVLPDRDEAGSKYAEAVSGLLRAEVCDVRRVDLPGLADGDDIEQWVEIHGDDAADKLRALLPGQLPTMGRWLDEFVEWRESNTGRDMIGLGTGLQRTDAALFGWHGLMLLAAQPGIGKTTLALQAAVRAVSRSQRAVAVYFSAEMTGRALAGRLLSMRTGIDYRKLALPDADMNEAAEHDGKILKARQNFINDIGERMVIIGPDDIEEADRRGNVADWMRRIVVRHLRAQRCDEAFVVIDNMQQLPLSPPDNRGGGSSQWYSDLERDRYAIEQMMRINRGIESSGARCATVVISETSKASQKDGKPDMTGVLGSGRLIYKADAVLALTRRDDAEEKGKDDIWLSILKGRDGVKRHRVLLNFQPGLHLFEESDHEVERRAIEAIQAKEEKRSRLHERHGRMRVRYAKEDQN